MDIATKSRTVRQMFDSIASRYDLGNSVLSLGVHHLWRKKLLGLVEARPNGKALDVCTGTGDLLPLLKKKFGTVIGVDFCLPMLECGSRKEKIKNSGGMLVQGDGLQLPFADDIFDCISVAFGVRNFADLELGLQELKRVLKPGGTLLVLEFGQPRIPVFKEFYNWYSAVLMPRIGGLVTGNKAAYEYLPATAKQFPCDKEFTAILEQVGFLPEKTCSLTGGIAYAYSAVKR